MDTEGVTADGRWRWDGRRWVAVQPDQPASAQTAGRAGLPSGVDLNPPAWVNEDPTDPDWLPSTTQIRLPPFHPAAAGPASRASYAFRLSAMGVLAALALLAVIAAVFLSVRG